MRVLHGGVPLPPTSIRQHTSLVRYRRIGATTTTTCWHHYAMLCVEPLYPVTVYCVDRGSPCRRETDLYQDPPGKQMLRGVDVNTPATLPCGWAGGLNIRHCLSRWRMLGLRATVAPVWWLALTENRLCVSVPHHLQTRALC